MSVRDASEGAVAANGAAIVDIKEPFRGPLGAADVSVTAEILAAVAGRVPVTLACGELADGPTRIARHVRDVLTRTATADRRPVAVKAGPAGLDTESWGAAFREFVANVPPDINTVAVAYADWRRAACLSPEDVIEMAGACGARLVLVDTFDKSGPGLFRAVSSAVIAQWVARAHDLKASLALAGKLTGDDIEQAIELGADIVGVRTAACSGGRHGRVDRAKILGLARLCAPLVRGS